MGGCAGSINSRLASGDKASFFCQPVPLDLELADLLVEPGLQGVLVGCTLRATRGENLRHFLLELMFPVRNLRGMHAV